MELAGQDLKGNAGVHLVSGAIISAAFLTLGIFILVGTNLRLLTRHWEEKIQVCIYLADDLEPGDHGKIKSKLENMTEISKVEYVSKKQALSDFKAMLGDNAGLLEGLDENPLPASFIVGLSPEARKLENLKVLSTKLSAWPEVAEVDYGGRLIEDFTSAIRVVEAAVIFMGGLILIAVVFIISNTIRLTMYSRRDEIGIMKLVGASDMLIRLPFILEGMVQGGGAALFGVVVLWVMYWVGLQNASWPGVFSGFTPGFLPGSALWALVAGGAFLGAAGSMSRFRDFLRV